MTTQAVRPVFLTIAPKIPTLADVIKGTVPPVTGDTLQIPPWVQNGDLMVMYEAMTWDPQVPSRYGPKSNTWANSWTGQEGFGWSTGNSFIGGSTRGLAVRAYYRVANNEPSSYDISWYMAGYAPTLYEGEVNLVQILFLVVFNGSLIKGVDDVGAFPYGYVIANHPIWEPAASSISMSGFTLQEDHEPFFAAFASNESRATTITAPSGMTILCDAQAGSGVQDVRMVVAMKVGSGDTGAASASFSSATYSTAIMGGYVR